MSGRSLLDRHVAVGCHMIHITPRESGSCLRPLLIQLVAFLLALLDRAEFEGVVIANAFIAKSVLDGCDVTALSLSNDLRFVLDSCWFYFRLLYSDWCYLIHVQGGLRCLL